MDFSDIRTIQFMTFYDHDFIHKRPQTMAKTHPWPTPRQSWCDGKLKVLSEEGRHLEGGDVVELGVGI